MKLSTSESNEETAPKKRIKNQPSESSYNPHPPHDLASTPPLLSNTEDPSERELREYWDHITKLFSAQMDQLSQTTDARKRMNLIQSIATYVRYDTLATLDWVSTLKTASEQEAALKAINDNALVGIGARIKKDETGLPFIIDTSILSASAASDMIENGDHIAGIIDPNGNIISFENLSMQQIVKHLRGKAGSQVELLMQRDESAPFPVPINRSMIIMERPF